MVSLLFDGYRIIQLGDRHTYVNNLLKFVTLKWKSQKLNSWPLIHESNVLSLHQQDTLCVCAIERYLTHIFAFMVHLDDMRFKDHKIIPRGCKQEKICLWARGHCRISPPHFLAKCCKRQLNQGSFVLLYFWSSTFSDLYWVCLSVFSCTVLFVSICLVIGCEHRLRNDLYCVVWGVKLYFNQQPEKNICFAFFLWKFAFSVLTLLVGRQEGHLACKKTEWWGAGMVICLEHMAQLMPLPLTVSCLSEIQIGFTFLVPAHPGSPGKRAVKRVCVCVFLWKISSGLESVIN